MLVPSAGLVSSRRAVWGKRFGGTTRNVGCVSSFDATSRWPSRFCDLDTPADFRKVADEVREVTGGIPIGFKLSAQHIEADIDFALDVGVEYIILDGRGGGTGAAPEVFKSNISVPTMAALARARRHLDTKRVLSSDRSES